MSLQAHASQTVGPYFHLGLDWLALDAETPIGPRRPTQGGAAAPRILDIRGRVYDGVGSGVGDAMLEIWRPANARQSSAPGTVPPPQTAAEGSNPIQVTAQALAEQGFGRLAVDASGAYHFRVVQPEVAPGALPFLVIQVTMRGLLKAACTRLYLPSESGSPQGAKPPTDPVLDRVPENRRSTLWAQPDGSTTALRFDIHMQGPDETVFFSS